ncbi:Methylamine utilization protein MauE [compost metagenome]
MDIMGTAVRFLISFMFISGLPEKIIHFKKHIYYISTFEILNKKTIRLFGVVDILLQILAVTLLLFSSNKFLCVISSIFLLLLYSLAITINLLRGKRDLSCGCGGLVGNHKLSWWLVFRNLVLILIVISLLFLPESLISLRTLQEKGMDNQVSLSFLYFLSIVLLYYTIISIRELFFVIKNRLDEIRR